jgi:hypothetical protein
LSVGRETLRVRRTHLEQDGIPASVTDGFLKSFAASFTNTFGADSLFVRTVSDLLTLSLARMLIAKGRLTESDSVAVFSDEEALDILRTLIGAHPSLKVPLLQEPLGHCAAGAIEQTFETLFGPSVFRSWLAAFERRAFDSCRAIARISS